jgi:hypothetical protein
VYRFNVDPSGRTDARVAKGRLTTGTVEVREGKEAVIGDGSSELLSFDKKAADTFDAWSKDRAKSLIAANSNLARSSVNLSQARFFLPFGVSGWSSPFSRFGLRGGCGGWWYFDPFFGSFIYLPDAFGGCSPFSSPYGYSYQTCYYPGTGAGYVEEPGEGNPAKKPGKHPGGVPKHPGGPIPADRSLGANKRLGGNHTPTLGANRGGSLGHQGGSEGSGRATIGHSSPSYGASHSSVGHSPGSTYSGGSSSGGHVSSASASASSSSTSTSSTSTGGGHHH